MAALNAAMPGNVIFPVGVKIDGVEGGGTGAVGAEMVLSMANIFGKIDGSIAMADAKIVSESTKRFFGKLGVAVAVSTLFLLF
mmetsp:Transcript_8842/g.18131  ORF Transcript_8842/g.18131 Transcript_8842/m.18131 type:complete len:83 (-) Transcript_8842:336-584(-)